MKIYCKNKHWKINKDYNLDKILYLLIDRPYSNAANNFYWLNEKGQYHREYDLPSVIYENGYVQWREHWSYVRENNKPTIISTTGRTTLRKDYDFIYNNNKIIKNCGVYRIVNKVNGKFYIGSSIDLYKRKSTHLSAIKTKKHKNPNIKEDTLHYNLKVDNFTFDVLVYCNRDKIKFYEQILLDLHQNNPLSYNRAIDAESSWKGLKLSEETKIKMSEAQKGANNPNYGKKGSNHPKHDPTIYHFINKTLDIEEKCTQYSLRTKYDLNYGNLSSVIKGRQKSIKGWKLA